MRVVIDTNVYISAIIYGGKAEEVLKNARKGKFDLFTSSYLLGELAGVLEEKFNFRKEEVILVLDDLLSFVEVVSSREEIQTLESKGDNKVLECAVAANADYIITGDKKHLLPLKQFRDSKIVQASDFLGIF